MTKRRRIEVVGKDQLAKKSELRKLVERLDPKFDVFPEVEERLTTDFSKFVKFESCKYNFKIS
jgi:hypothetical protein